MQRLMIFIGGLVSICSAFFVVAAIGDLLSGNSDTQPGVLWGLLVFFSLTCAGGIYLIVSTRKRSHQQRTQQQERDVLRLVAARGGRITPFEVAAESELSATQAQAILESLCQVGMAELQVTEQGNLIYVFRSFMADDEKTSAKGPLE